MKEVLQQLKKIHINSSNLLEESLPFRLALNERMQEISDAVGEHDPLRFAELLLKALPEDECDYDSDILQKLLILSDLYNKQNLDGQYKYELSEFYMAVDTKYSDIKRKRVVSDLDAACGRCQDKLEKESECYREVATLRATLHQADTDDKQKITHFNERFQRKETQVLLNTHPDSAVKRFVRAVGYILANVATLGLASCFMQHSFFRSPQQKLRKEAASILRRESLSS